MTVQPTEVERAVAEADAWLDSHKVTDTWRTMNRLRDTLVRLAGEPLPRVVYVSQEEAERDSTERVWLP